MKRHFLTGLKAFAVSVMALLAVSCYDDSKIWDSFDDLKNRVDALEAKINEQVATLNNVIGNLEAKVAVVKVEKNAAGNYVLTFSNNETLEISAADANANNTGLVTTVTEGDVTYWAVVGADGKVTKLNAVVHPDTKLSFKVDPETGFLLVSYDGQSYESTGVFVNDDTTFNVVEKFVDADGYVVITVGGVDYKLPKVSANTFEILSGMVFFSAGETKTIPVDMNGVVTSMVAKQPSGWTVELADGALNVTAPADESEEGDDYVDDDFGGGIWPMSSDEVNDTYGKIEIWVVTEDGKTLVGSVSVSLEGKFADVYLSEDKDKGTMVNLELAMVEIYDWNDDWTEQIPTGEYEPLTNKVFFGACEADKFDGASLSDLLDMWVVGEDEAKNPSVYATYTLGENNYPVWLTERSVPLADMLGAAPEYGKTYVVWAYNPSPEGYKNSAESFLLTYYVPTKVTMSVPSVSWNNAELDIAVEGVDKFMALIVDKEAFEMYTSPADPANGIYEPGMWTPDFIEMYASYGMNFTFMELFAPAESDNVMAMHYFEGTVYEGAYKGSLVDFGPAALADVYSYAPGSELVLCVLPLSPYKVDSDYSMADVDTLSFSLNKIVAGGAATVAFGESTADVKSFKVEMTSTSSVFTVYSYWKTSEYEKIVANLESGKTIQDYMIENYKRLYMTDKASYEVYAQDLVKATSYTVAAMAIDADGKCSEVVTKSITTEDYPYDNTNMKVEVTTVAFNPDNAEEVTVTYKVTGANSLVVYAKQGTPSLYGNKNYAATLEANLVSYGPEYTSFKKFDVGEDGTVAVTYSKYTSSYYKWSYAIAYKYENKKVTALTNSVITDLSTFNAQ